MATTAFLCSGGKKPKGTVEIAENGLTNVSGYAYADVNVDAAPTLQSINVSPETYDVSVYPDPGYDGISGVTVSAVTAAIDANISEENIRSGVTVLGVTGTLEPGEELPDYLVKDGDTVTTLYFNTELPGAYIKLFLSSLTYGSPEPGTGIRYRYLGPGFITAADLSDAGFPGEYALVWADINDPAIFYSTVAVSAYGVSAPGWQTAAFSPSSPFTADLGSSDPAIIPIKDFVFAKQSVAFGSHGGGGGSGKAHTFAVPAVSGSYTYSGLSQSPVVTGFYSDFMTGSGDTSATHAGTYTITFSLSDPVNCQWSDGTVSDKSVPWSISKAALPTPSCAPSFLTLSPAVPSASFSVNRAGNGAVTASSDDPSLISVSVSGNTVTVTALSFASSDTATVSVNIGEGSDHLAYQGSVTYAVDVMSAADSVFTVRTTAANVTVPFAFRESVQNGVTIDWGDGSAPEIPNGTYTADASYGIDYTVLANHTYADAGIHTIKITPADNVIWAFGRQNGINNHYNVFNKISSYLNSSGSGEPSGVTAVSFEGGFGLLATGMYAFKCTSITSFKAVGSSFDAVSYSAFDTCPYLTTVELPAGTSVIASLAIAYCQSMSTLRIKAPNPPEMYANSFEAMKSTCRILVPSASVNDYRAVEHLSSRALYISADN